MSDDSKPLDELAEAALEGLAVDWASAESEAGASGRDTVRQLRVIAGIAELHRTLDAASGAVALESWGRLKILEGIGHGSFGDVYRAWDTKLDREVALKLLRTDAAGQDSTTVLKEARLLARVRHPNVVTVYDADEIDGRVGLWMEFIHGRDLEQILAERKTLDHREVTRIGIDLCRALSAVHDAGLLHRDIKTQNLMQAEDGHLVLMDFGTGWDLEKAPSSTSDTAGTPLYLAPEIFDGVESTIRSDIYSAGVLLFHLLTGGYPVRGATVQEVRAAHSNGERPRFDAGIPGVPRALAGTIGRACERDPSKRFHSAGEMLAALEAVRRHVDAPRRLRLIAAGFGLAILLVGATAWLSRGGSRVSAESALAFKPQDWILVSKFENRTGEKLLDGTLDYALGLELSNSHHVNVVSRERIGDALRLMRKPPDTPIDAAVGREVCLRDGGIRALLTGRIEKAGPAYLLNVALVDPARATTLAAFTEKSAGTGGSLAAVRRISDRVRAALGEATAPEREGTDLVKVTTSNLRALQLYSRADELMGTEGPRGQAAAERLLREAVAVDPAFASAWIHLAWTLANQEKPSEEVRECAEKALHLADATTDREKYFIRGSYYYLVGQTDNAITAYEALLALYPDHDWAANNLLHIYDWQHDPNQLEKGIAIEARMADLRPRNFYWNCQAAITALFFKPDPAAEARFYGRAAALLTPKIRENNLDAVFIALQPFHANWLVGEIGAANTEVDRVAATLDSLAGRTRDSLAGGTVGAYLTLGRLEAAAETSRKISDPAAQNTLLAEIAFLRGNDAEFRDRLKSQPDPNGPGISRTVVVLEARMGMTSDARRFVEESERVPPPSPNMREDIHTLRGEIALAHGDLATAARELEATLQEQGEILTSRYYLGMESLAAILAKQGDLGRAIDILERRPDRFSAAGGGDGAAYWLRNRMQLARLYRKAGRVDDARALETELASLLAYADPDHPIKLELARLRS